MCKPRTTKLTRSIFAVAALLLLTAVPVAQATPIPTATVVHIVDGDTVDIQDDVQGRLRIRILGIDTPETLKPDYTIGCWGPEATAYAESTLLGQRVALVTDPTQNRYDQYGRTLGYLDKDDDWDYSVEAARAGMAHSYVYGGLPVTRYSVIAAAEQEAKNAQRGLWGAPCFGETESVPI